MRNGVCGGNSRLPYPVPAHSLVVQSNLACVAGDIVGARKKVRGEPLKASGEAARNQKVKLNEEEEEEEEEELHLTATPFKRWPHGYFILVHTIAQLVKFFKNPFNMTPLSRFMVFWKF